jgi:cell division initiation protein
MSSTELDLPVLVTPEQIRRREFVTTRRGYDVEQVRDYLEQVARQVEQMDAMLRTAKLRAGEESGHSSSRVDPYEELSRRFAEVLRATDREADRLRREAKDEADRIVREARADADRIRLDAQTRAEHARDDAERALREARERADRTMSGLASRRAALVEQLSAMQERLLGVARELEETIERPENDAEVVASLEGAADRDAAAGAERDRTVDGAHGGAEPTPGTPAQGATDPGAADRPPSQRPAGTGGVIDLRDPDAVAEELWSSSDPDDLRIPEIPPLDLDWDDDSRT